MEELGVADLIAMVRALQSQMNSMREMYEARIAELEAENAALKTRVADLGRCQMNCVRDGLSVMVGWPESIFGGAPRVGSGRACPCRCVWP